MAAIGLDAADWGLLQRLMESGDMPNLRRIRERSAVAQLSSEGAHRHGHVWNQFLAGRRMESVRVLDGMLFDPVTYRAWGAPSEGEPFFGGEASRHVISFDIPHLWPRADLRGASVISWGGHDSRSPRSSRPAGLLREIDATFGAHPAFNNDCDHEWHRGDQIERLAGALTRGASQRAPIARLLQQRWPEWRLFITVMSESHSIGETCWHGVDPAHPMSGHPTAPEAWRHLVTVHRAIDDALGGLAADLPSDTTLVVFSLHGSRIGHGDVASLVLLPELLNRFHGGAPLLRNPEGANRSSNGPLRAAPGARETWDTHMTRWRRHAPLASRLRRLAHGTLRGSALRRARGVSGRVASGRSGGSYGVLGLYIPGEADLGADHLRPPADSTDWAPPTWYRSFWPSVPSFALPSSSDGLVRINLQGRESGGVVPAAGYRAACDDVDRLLAKCRDPRTGLAVAEAVVPLTGDPFEPNGIYADLEVRWAGSPDTIEHPELGTIGPFPLRRMASHTPDGFALISGPRVAPADLGRHSALDLPPTLLRLAGLTRSPGMQGTSFAPLEA